jgi:hypothetical protein
MFVSTALSTTMRPLNMLIDSNLKRVIHLSVEPVTAAVAAYLVAEGPKFVRAVRRRRCRWFLKRHKDDLVSVLVEETIDPLLQILNIIHPANLLHVIGLGVLLILCIALFIF